MNKLILFALFALVASEEFSQSSSYRTENGEVMEDNEYVNGEAVNQRNGIDQGNDGFYNGGFDGGRGSNRRSNSGSRFGGSFGNNKHRGFGGDRGIGSRSGILRDVLGRRGNSFDSFNRQRGGGRGDFFNRGGGFGFDDNQGFGGFDSHRGGRRGGFGGNNGGLNFGGGNGRSFDFGGNGGGSDFSEFDNQRSSLKEADRENELYDAANEYGLKDALQYQGDEGHRAKENSNYGAEEYDRGQNFHNRDEDNQIQYSHDKQEHIIDQVSYGSKDRVSESSGDQFESGHKEIDQHNQQEEGYNNENYDQLTEEQRRERERAAKNSEHIFEEENHEQSGTQESNDF